MAEQLTIAIIGCGGMAEAHRRAYQMLWQSGYKSFRITATCDLEIERANAMADRVAEFQGVRPNAYGDIDKMLAAEKELMAADICAPHNEHHVLAIACFEAGLHVTIEKPLAITLRAGRKMLEAAKSRGCLLQVAENYRRTPTQRAINWALKMGWIGEPRMFLWVDTFERLWYWGWREHKEIAGGGWTLDGGVHFADLMRYHIGEVDEIFAVSRTFLPVRYMEPETRSKPVEISVEDTTMALVKFNNGVLGQWVLTSAAPGKGYNMRVIYGQEGCIDFQDGFYGRTTHEPINELVNKFMESITDEERKRLFPMGITDSVAIELHEFIEGVLNRKPIETDGNEGYKSQAICMAVYESALLNAPVKVEAVARGEIEGYQAELNRQLGL
ncbi:MAG: Gfo/Idh/MocA family oxidoreductase [Armatimonadetes bacterium]|nr:Gfo/Idh/MocA family oxidoreductase [Armatimonadota bacterium]